MPVLTLLFKNTPLDEFPLKSGQTLTIGRSQSNDIVIDNMSVSGLHARIDSVSATFILTDLESTNGTFVNEKLISSHTLRDKDLILIGKHHLIFDRSDLNKEMEAETEDENKTHYLDTAQYRDLLKKNKMQGPEFEEEESEFEGQKYKNFFIKLLKKFL